MSSDFTLFDLKNTGKTIVAGVLWFCTAIVFAGIFTPDYSHSFQAISELAAPGTLFLIDANEQGA